MNFEAYTIGEDLASRTSATSGQLWDKMRTILTPLLDLNKAGEFPLEPHWTIKWEPHIYYAIATFLWRGIPVCIMPMIYCDRARPIIKLLFGNLLSYAELANATLPAAFMQLCTQIVMLDPHEVREVMEELGGLDHSVACVYFELMEQKHQTIQ